MPAGGFARAGHPAGVECARKPPRDAKGGATPPLRPGPSGIALFARARRSGRPQPPRYSASIRATISATDGAPAMPETECPAAQMSFHRFGRSSPPEP